MILQGGPGASSVGYGAFYESGPFNEQLQARNVTWVDTVNMLYVDNPVGAGFSYVDDESYLTTNNSEIAADMVALLTAFFKQHSEYSNTPFYIFCESYGGKMTTGIANALLQAISAGKLDVNFRGVALGDSWISGLDFVKAWPPLLQNVGMMDGHDVAVAMPAVNACAAAVAAGNWADATNLWGNVEDVLSKSTYDVNFYNYLQSGEFGWDDDTAGSTPMAFTAVGRTWESAPLGVKPRALETLARRHLDVYYPQDLAGLMNGPVKTAFGSVIPAQVQWGAQSNDVFSALSTDFMRPVVTGPNSVDALLAAGLNVTVYEGMLDVICTATGAEAWMAKLTWPFMDSFNRVNKVPFFDDAAGHLAGFVKTYKNLRRVLITHAGHMVPHDHPVAAAKMVAALTEQGSW